jgi:type II secretory pathway pseudopilin PulG
MKRGKLLNNSGQVWIETVIYTLIAFVMIGLVLSFARPKIEEMQNQAILQQSTEMLKYIDSVILSMGVAGNQRIIELQIKEGEFKIDGENDKLIFSLESKNVYSEPGKNISDGSVTVLTEEKSGFNLVTLTTDYSNNYNIKYNGKDEAKIISKASTSYKLLISNEGKDMNGKTLLNMSIS